MKIGFDVSQTGSDKAGCGFLAHNLIRQLLAGREKDERYTLYPTFGSQFWDERWQDTVFRTDHAGVETGLSHQDFDSARSFWGNPPADLDAALGSPDIVHANNFFCPMGLKRARLIYTLYDLSFIENPAWTTEANRINCFMGLFNAASHADVIMAISEFSRRHFLDTFPHYPADRVKVMKLGSRFEADSPTSQPQSVHNLGPGCFWLAVGTIEPRKNYEGLIRAYAALKNERHGRVRPLVVAGKSGWLMEHFPTLLSDLGLEQDVIFAGYVEDAELRWLYRHCVGFIYPTFWEGFGLPVLEAMHEGAAVVTSRTSSIPEIVGDAGLLIDPYDTAAIAQAMAMIEKSEDVRHNLSEAARLRAREFSWAAGARTVRAAYREALEREPFLARETAAV